MAWTALVTLSVEVGLAAAVAKCVLRLRAWEEGGHEARWHSQRWHSWQVVPWGSWQHSQGRWMRRPVQGWHFRQENSLQCLSRQTRKWPGSQPQATLLVAEQLLSTLWKAAESRR